MPKVGFKFSPESKLKMRLAKLGKPGWSKGKKLTLQHRRNLSKSWSKSKHFTPEVLAKLKGRTPWNKGKSMPKKTRFKVSLAKMGSIPWNKGKHYPAVSGSKCHLWKGGITPIHRALRKSLEYRLWRTAVFERDNYACIWCGAKSRKGKKVILNADHIKRFSDYPELRFAIDNGRTLCNDCHRTTETYGKRNTTSTYLNLSA